MDRVVVIGSSAHYTDKLLEILKAYSASGRPPVVFAEPQIRKGSRTVHAWMFRFYGADFVIEMPVSPSQKDDVAAAIGKVAIVMDTLSAPIEAIVTERGVEI